MEHLHGDLVVLYRVIREEEAILRDELERIAGARGIAFQLVAGDHATPEGSRLLSPAHLRELVPDIAGRDVYVCGPPAMTDATERNVRAAGVPPRPSTSNASPSRSPSARRRPSPGRRRRLPGRSSP
jgi:ferredoxin-NADP reductase